MCAQVIEQPLDKRIIVLRRGTSSGLIGVIPAGGHMFPSSRVGCREEWKKAQKKAKKKKHFWSDEKKYSQSYSFFYFFCVFTLKSCFSRDVSSSLDHS